LDGLSWCLHVWNTTSAWLSISKHLHNCKSG
jgi:hypothetical protein